MPELEAVEATPETAKREQQIDPAVLRLLATWRSRGRLYLLAKFGSSLILRAKVTVVEVFKDHESGYVVYLADPFFFNPEFDPTLLGQYGTAQTRKGFTQLWKFQLNRFTITVNGSTKTRSAKNKTLILRRDGEFQVELSEKPPQVEDGYYGKRIKLWW